MGISPSRIIEARRVRIFPALLSGLAASIAFLAFYYATLGLLPSTYVVLPNYHPVAAWNERFDLTQFFGTIFDPPYATKVTWWVGLAVVDSMLIASGAVYAIGCSWALAKSTPKLGSVFGIMLFIVVASAVSLGSGFNPAVMRQSLPDVGFFFLGWTGWADIQLLISFVIYGIVLSMCYAHAAGDN